MMEWLTNNFAEFANIYMQIIIEIVLAGTALFYAYWLKPFVINKKAAYAAALIYWSVFMFISHLNTPKYIDRVLTVGVVVLSVMVLWFIDYKRNPIQKILLCTVFRIICWLPLEMLSEVGFYERDFVAKFDFYKNNISVIIIEFIIWIFLEYFSGLLLLYISIRLLHKVYIHKEEEMTWQELIMLLMPSVSILLVKPIMSSYFHLWMDGIKNGSIRENIPGNLFRILFCIFSYLSILVVIAFYQKIKSRQEDEFARRTLEKQIEDMQSDIERVEDSYEKMKSMRHDMVNHMTVIKGLAETGKTDELTKYISDWQNRFEELQPVIKTGNAVTDVVMSEFAMRCEKENVPFECKFIYPEKLNINPFDMCVILTNALQNAIEASKKADVSYISICSAVRDKVFLVSVKNKTEKTVLLNEEGMPVSTKHEKGHGYGLRNIQSIAEKYNGTIDINIKTDEGNLFILNVMLVG